MNTLLLDITQWDLVLDAAGNIAAAAAPYQLAQDVASAIRLFLGELWYDTTKGVPYFDTIQGESPPVTLFQEYMVRAALTVPSVASAQCVVNSLTDRTVSGQVLFTTDTGATGVVQL